VPTDTRAAPVATLALALASLPALGQPLEGGTFFGVITRPDGTHVAVVKLTEEAEDIAWQDAMDWAAKLGGQLPSRPIAAMLFAHLKGQLRPRWHWCDETDEDDASYAWICVFSDGYQLTDRKSFEGCAVAVRCIPLAA